MKYYYDTATREINSIDDLFKPDSFFESFNRDTDIYIGNFNPKKSRPFIYDNFIIRPFRKGYKLLFLIDKNNKLRKASGFVVYLSKNI